MSWFDRLHRRSDASRFMDGLMIFVFYLSLPIRKSSSINFNIELKLASNLVQF
jgi:hypothetical protein